MKCPKCGYIGFESSDRCRNCGYEFALVVREASAPAEIEMRRASDTGGPLADLALTAASLAGERRRMATGKELDLDRVIGAPEASSDLPLFNGASTEGEIDRLGSAAAAPRRPLAVRRGSEVVRARPRTSDEHVEKARNRNLELPLPDDGLPSAHMTRRPGSWNAAPPMDRALASLVDTAILGSIDLIVVYLTLRVCALSLADLEILPVLPLAAFLLLLNGAYLLAFTATGGQTIGKMAFALKVVGPAEGPVSPARATVRAAACLISALCLGAGLVPALLGGRALHDRLADTDVVRLTG